MVRLQTKYELNHIYNMGGINEPILIGAGQAFNTQTFELFEKSLALTSDLKRIPILRSLWGSWDWTMGGLGVAMNASGITQAKFRVFVYDDVVHEDNLICTFLMYIRQDASSIVFVDFENIQWGLKGGRILSDKIHIRTELSAQANVAGVDFAEWFGCTMNFEIDWFELGKDELLEYLLEHMYVDKSPEAVE